MRINETVEKSRRSPLARFVTPGRRLAPIAVAVLSCSCVGCSREESLLPDPDSVHEPRPGILYAIDVQTGAEVWRHRWHDNLPWPIVAAEGRLYYRLIDGQEASLHAVEGKSGKTVWHTPYPAKGGLGRYSMSMLAEGGLLYCVGTAGNIDAIESLSGALRWHQMITETAGSLPTANSDGLMVATSQTEILILDKGTGRTWRAFRMEQEKDWKGHFTSDRWFFFSSDSIVAMPPDGNQAMWTFSLSFPPNLGGRFESPLFDDRHVCLGTSEGELIILDAESGQVDARLRHGMTGYVHCALAGGIVYVKSLNNGTIAALDLHTKDVKWRRRFAWAAGWHSQLLIDGEVLCFTGGGRRVQAVDRNTGRDLWHVVTKHSVRTADIPFDGKRIYVACQDH